MFDLGRNDDSFLTGEGSVVLWVRADDVETKSQQGIFSKEGAGTPHGFTALYFEDGSLCLSIENRMIFGLDRMYRVGADAFKDGDWHHVSYTFGANGARVYVDGVRVIYDFTYVLGLYHKFGSYEFINEEPWIIGGRNDTGTPTANLFGSVARFAFIPVQLSGSEISDLMDGQLNARGFEVVQGSFERTVE